MLVTIQHNQLHNHDLDECSQYTDNPASTKWNMFTRIFRLIAVLLAVLLTVYFYATNTDTSHKTRKSSLIILHHHQALIMNYKQLKTNNTQTAYRSTSWTIPHFNKKINIVNTCCITCYKYGCT